MWKDLDEVENIEFLNSAESSLLVEATFPLPEATFCLPTLDQRVSLALSEKHTTSSPKTVKYHVR